MTHIAAQEVVIVGRYMRQRCAWCGEVILDYDLSTIASTDGKGPGSFEMGRLVEIDGNCRSVIPGNAMPDNCCALLEITR